MEKPKRLQPKTETLRRLYTLSGNQCAYPGCNKPMFNSEGNFVGQICHIEAAQSGGERFNKKMTDEERRSFDNLMLMCYEHHIETDKEDQYPVCKMQEMKRQHEEIYSNIDRFIHLMQSAIIDVTANISVGEVKSLSNLYITLYGQDYREERFISEDVSAFNSAIRVLAKFSPEAKKIFGICLSRAVYEKNSYGRKTENIFIDPHEIERATQIEKTHLRSIFHEIENSGFLIDDELENGRFVFFICLPNNDSNLWEMIKRFCEKQSLDVALMVSNLNFTAID